MKVTLSNVRLAFPKLFKPETVNGEGEPAYSASFILSPTDNAASLKALEDAVRKVAAEKWADKAPAILKELSLKDKLPVHDGDTKSQYDGFEGNKFVSSRSTVRPLVIAPNKTPLTEADGKPYAGCYVNASVEIWAQDNAFGKRINAQLRGVQFVRDGDAFGGATPAGVDEFESIDDAGDDLDSLFGATGT